jgi:hypothetical protein
MRSGRVQNLKSFPKGNPLASMGGKAAGRKRKEARLLSDAILQVITHKVSKDSKFAKASTMLEIGGGKDKVSLLTCLVASVIKTIISRGDAFSLEKLVQMGGLHPDQNSEGPDVEPVEVTFTVAGGEDGKKMILANPDDVEASV